MKKLLSIALCVIMFGAVALSACDNGGGTGESPVYLLTVSDIEMVVGTTEEVEFSLLPNPSGLKALKFDILEGEENGLAFNDNEVTASAIDVYTVRLTVSKPKTSTSAEVIYANKNFTITVTDVPLEGGNLIRNHSFENGLTSWEYEFDLENYTEEAFPYRTTISDGDSAHSGIAAINLFWDENMDEGFGYAIDLKLSQTIEVEADTTYLFSFWFVGHVTRVTLNLIDTEAVVATQNFNAFTPVIGQNGYANVGMEYESDAAEALTAQIHIVAPKATAGGVDATWGYIDDIFFGEGTLDDLAKDPVDPEQENHNFLKNMDFANSRENWTVEGSGLGAVGDGGMSVSNTAKVSQTVVDTPVLTNYKAAFKYRLGNSMPTSAKVSILDGDIEAASFNIPLVNKWEWLRVELDIGANTDDLTFVIEVTGACWIEFKGAAIWSDGYVKPISNQANITITTVDGVAVEGTAPNALTVSLPSAKYAAIGTDTKSKIGYSALSDYATFTAVFAEDVITIVVTAEDETTTKTYTIAVTEDAVKAFIPVSLVNAGFEDTTADAPGWTYSGINKGGAWLQTGDKNTGSYGVNIWTANSKANDEFMLYQMAGTDFVEGEKVKLSFYVCGAVDQGTLTALIGAQEIAVEGNYGNWDYVKVEIEHTLTNDDIVDGAIKVGIKFVLSVDKATLKLDDFVLEVER